MASQWFYQLMGEQIGPVSSAELRALAQRGTISTETPIANAPNGPWVPAARVKGLFAVAIGMPPSSQAQPKSSSPDPPAVATNERVPIALTRRAMPSAVREQAQTTGPTAYTASNLIPGEKILYAANISPMIFLPSCILIILFPVGILIAMCGSEQATYVGIWLAVVCVVLFPVYTTKAMITFLTTECVLTDRRVVGKTGFISRNSLELLLTKVESFAVNQGILGRVFDYGTVTVTGTGGSHTPLRGIAKPLELRKRAQQQISVVQG